MSNGGLYVSLSPCSLCQERIVSDLFQHDDANVTVSPSQVVINFTVNMVTLIFGSTQWSVLHMHNWTGIMRYTISIIQVLIADAVLVGSFDISK